MTAQDGMAVVATEHLLEAVPQAELRRAIADAIIAQGKSGGQLVPKAGIHTSGGGRFHVMPAIAGEYAGMKWVSVGEAPDPTGPYIHALLILTDVRTGRTLAIMDAGPITGWRTAAVTAIAAQACCDPGLDRIAILGCGLQARTHLSALKDIFPIAEVIVRARAGQSHDRFEAHAHALGITVRTVRDTEALARSASFLLIATPLSIPEEDRILPDWIAADAFVAALDHAHALAGHGEYGFDRILTDDIGHHRGTIASGLMPPLPDLHGDLFTLLEQTRTEQAGTALRTLFVPPGIALADLAIAAMLHRRSSGLE